MFQQMGAAGQNPNVSPWVSGLTGFASGAGQAWADKSGQGAQARAAREAQSRMANILTESGVDIDPALVAELGVDDAKKIYDMQQDGQSTAGARQVFNPETGLTEWYAPGTELHGQTVGASNYGKLKKGLAPDAGAVSATLKAPVQTENAGMNEMVAAKPSPAVEALTKTVTGPEALAKPVPKVDLVSATGVGRPVNGGQVGNQRTDRPREADQAVQPDGGIGRFAPQAAPTGAQVGSPPVSPVSPVMQDEFAGSNLSPENGLTASIAKFFSGGGSTDVPIDRDGMPDPAQIQAAEPGKTFQARIGGQTVTLQVVVENGVKKVKKVDG